MLPIDDLSCEVLILGAGGAGMLAALHVTSANRRARIIIAEKGLLDQSGCTRMVQRGYNCFFSPAVSHILGLSVNDLTLRGAHVTIH
jgi:succinate dehydrogenase/fumarate reductase flavoprotein subunit